MIKLTKIDNSKIVVNSDEIESIDCTHESSIKLKSGRRILVKEGADEIIELVINYKKSIKEERIDLKK